MTNKKIFLSVVAILALASSSFAQDVASTSSSAGLLGQRYVTVNAFTEDLRDISADNAFGGGLDVNLPLTATLDAGLSYSYEQLNDFIDIRQNIVSASLTSYTQAMKSGVRLFVDTSLGYAWTKVNVLGVSVDDDDGLWSFGIGAEIPLGTRSALTGRVGYSDIFERGDNEAWTYSAGVNHWFTDKVAGVASVTFVEDDSIIYKLGVNFRF